ncbi:unnamed protein product [Calicophoron daubneyi]|uniref:Galectin domain-containing protein n=1 Tax=Calicophoron daubneyi TaxID=300641 RepID=A0AAV2T1D6_CALDB
MKIEFDFPFTLQYGDTLEIRGTAGSEKFALNLLSDYLAFDPVECDKIVNDEEYVDALPIVETQPLQIIFENSGDWDVNAYSPETSSSCHGRTARRFGFRKDENFICKVCIRTDFYEVSLNGMPLAHSEHLVPVGSVHGMVIEGDSSISDLNYNNLLEATQYKVIHKDGSPKLVVADNRNHGSGTHKKPVQNSCPQVEEDQRRFLSRSAANILDCAQQEADGTDVENNEDHHLRLTRANSYQLVFGLDDEGDGDEILHGSAVPKSIMPQSQTDLLLMDDPNFVLESDGSETPKTVIGRKPSLPPAPNTRGNTSLARRFKARHSENKTAANVLPTPPEGILPKKYKFSASLQSIPAQATEDNKVNVTDSTYVKSNSNEHKAGYASKGSDTEISAPRSTDNVNKDQTEAQPTKIKLYRSHSVHNVSLDLKSEAHDNLKTYRHYHRPGKDRAVRRVHTMAPSRPNDHPSCANLLRSPLSVLDERWDQILPKIKPNMTQGRTSAENSPLTPTKSKIRRRYTVSYKHWYSQLGKRIHPHAKTFHYGSRPQREDDSDQGGDKQSSDNLITRSSEMEVTKNKGENPEGHLNVRGSSAYQSDGDPSGNLSSVASNSSSAYESAGSLETGTHKNPKVKAQRESDVPNPMKLEKNPSEPMLFIDKHPDDEEPCILESNVRKSHEIFSLYPWPERPTIQLELLVPNRYLRVSKERGETTPSPTLTDDSSKQCLVSLPVLPSRELPYSIVNNMKSPQREPVADQSTKNELHNDTTKVYPVVSPNSSDREKRRSRLPRPSSVYVSGTSAAANNSPTDQTATSPSVARHWSFLKSETRMNGNTPHQDTESNQAQFISKLPVRKVIELRGIVLENDTVEKDKNEFTKQSDATNDAVKNEQPDNPPRTKPITPKIFRSFMNKSPKQPKTDTDERDSISSITNGSTTVDSRDDALAQKVSALKPPPSPNMNSKEAKSGAPSRSPNSIKKLVSSPRKWISRKLAGTKK